MAGEGNLGMLRARNVVLYTYTYNEEQIGSGNHRNRTTTEYNSSASICLIRTASKSNLRPTIPFHEMSNNQYGKYTKHMLCCVYLIDYRKQLAAISELSLIESALLVMRNKRHPNVHLLNITRSLNPLEIYCISSVMKFYILHIRQCVFCDSPRKIRRFI